MPSLTSSGSPTFNGDGTCTIDSTGTDRLQAPAATLDEGQAWFAAFLKSRATAAAMSSDARIFSFEEADTAMVTLYWSGSSKQFAMARQNGATFGQAAGAVQSFGSAADVFVCGAWTSTQLKQSMGGAFVTAGQASVPVIAASAWDIARRSTSAVQYALFDYYWVATGLGTLSDANAATLAAFGAAGPSDMTAIPGSPALYWDATSLGYVDTFTGNALTLSLADSLALSEGSPQFAGLAPFGTYSHASFTRVKVNGRRKTLDVALPYQPQTAADACLMAEAASLYGLTKT